MDKPVAKLEHASAGRVRARVTRSDRSAATMKRVEQQLSAEPGVDRVEVNPATGSVLVRGADRRRLEQALDAALTVLASLGGDAPPDDRGVAEVVTLVRTAERRLREATGGRLSLRWIVPSAFVAFGLRELLRQGLTIGAVPWYVLLYYGVDSFLKLYPEHGPGAGAGADGASSQDGAE